MKVLSAAVGCTACDEIGVDTGAEDVDRLGGEPHEAALRSGVRSGGASCAPAKRTACHRRVASFMGERDAVPDDEKWKGLGRILSSTHVGGVVSGVGGRWC